MYRIEGLLRQIKTQPQMLVEEGVDYIFYSLLGRCVFNQDFGGKNISDIDKYFCTWFGRWLTGWIKENIDQQYEPKTLWWYHDIKMIAGDEQNEAKVFFDLCDQFFEDYRERKMDHIEKVLRPMKIRPKMYVAEEGVDHIFYFFLGCCVCYQDFGDKDIPDMDKYFCTWFGRWFTGWIKENIDQQYEPKTLWWYHDIKMIAGDGQDEAKIFFELCDRFYKDYRRNEDVFRKIYCNYGDEIILPEKKGYKSMHIEGLIALIKKRDMVLVEDERTDYICQFLMGYYYSASAYVIDKVTSDMDKNFWTWFGRWLVGWIQENIDQQYEPKTSWWYHDIKMIAGDEQNEVKVFYNLCDQFFEDYRERRGYFAEDRL
ncbi:MAG: hypothetical protein J1E62_07165 [Lachnospiraceae bacterium]|nr:hypothetical protein [Lachnospiraceae bacterium]